MIGCIASIFSFLILILIYGVISFYIFPEVWAVVVYSRMTNFGDDFLHALFENTKYEKIALIILIILFCILFHALGHHLLNYNIWLIIVYNALILLAMFYYIPMESMSDRSASVVGLIYTIIDGKFIFAVDWLDLIAKGIVSSVISLAFIFLRTVVFMLPTPLSKSFWDRNKDKDIDIDIYVN